MAGVASDVGWSTRHLEQRFRGRARHHAQGGGADHPVRTLGRRRARPASAARRRRRRVRLRRPGAPGPGVARPRRAAAVAVARRGRPRIRPRRTGVGAWQHRGMTTRADHNLWPGIGYDDAHAARSGWPTLGFEEGICVESPRHPARSSTARCSGPRAAGSWCTAAPRPTTPSPRAAGSGNVYVVCDDPDAVWAKAEALGARVLRPMEDTDYGSRRVLDRRRGGQRLVLRDLRGRRLTRRRAHGLRPTATGPLA